MTIGRLRRADSVGILSGFTRNACRFIVALDIQKPRAVITRIAGKAVTVPFTLAIVKFVTSWSRRRWIWALSAVVTSVVRFIRVCRARKTRFAVRPTKIRGARLTDAVKYVGFANTV